ncbi:hypothetical protein JZX86_09180 [Agrobacterium rosae]|uniref:hypothetical protein n=1 Tax=Agrobacterium rosae TaxID=1972867 RepID=UPI0019D371A8|nr:hypothetical protein [Agrobacterium rosae]MBN7805533.1 hypothetical protein [Agrobacterium rosae]
MAGVKLMSIALRKCLDFGIGTARYLTTRKQLGSDIARKRGQERNPAETVFKDDEDQSA